MQREELKQASQKIKMWQRDGERAPHKSLLLLFALGRLTRDEPRQMNYKEVKDDLKILLDEFGPPNAKHSPSYPFIPFCNDIFPKAEKAIWRIAGREKLNTKKDWFDRDLAYSIVFHMGAVHMTIDGRLKSIRKELSNIQEQLAHKLNIDFTTLKGCEKSHTKTNSLAIIRLMEYCNGKGVSDEIVAALKHV